LEIEQLRAKNDQVNYDNAVARLTASQELSARNKEMILRYLRDAALGKTARGRARTKVGTARRTGYIRALTLLASYVKKDFDQVSQADMESFIEALESGKIRSRRRKLSGRTHHVDGAPLGIRYVIDIKVNVRRFYRYLLGTGASYPALVDWFDLYALPKRTKALTEAEVQRMLDLARGVRERALVQVLFDGGLRLGELMNVRLRHVTFREVADGERCFFVEVPYSKTFPRTVALPMQNSTKWLGHWLAEHPAGPTVSKEGLLTQCDLDAQLFPMRVCAIAAFFHRHGEEALGKRVYPHLMRHSSATFWANKLPYFKFCKRFGWTMTSKMPQRYIDAAGVDELDTARIYRDAMKGEQAKQEEIKRRVVEAVENALEEPSRQGE
jgi:integrase